MVKQLHVVKASLCGWNVKQAGTSKPVATEIRTQKEAINIANNVAKVENGAEVIIHGLNGKIREANTINKKDPYPPRG